MEMRAKSSARDVTQLFEPPEPGRLAAVTAAGNPAELGGDGGRINQRPVQVERQYLAATHRACQVICGASRW